MDKFGLRVHYFSFAFMPRFSDSGSVSHRHFFSVWAGRKVIKLSQCVIFDSFFRFFRKVTPTLFTYSKSCWITIVYSRTVVTTRVGQL